MQDRLVDLVVKIYFYVIYLPIIMLNIWFFIMCSLSALIGFAAFIIQILVIKRKYGELARYLPIVR